MKKKRSLSPNAVEKQRKELGTELKRRRQAKKLTQEAAAAMAGTSRKEIATIELGKADYQIDPFIRYCAILDSPILPLGFDVVIPESVDQKKPFDVI